MLKALGILLISLLLFVGLVSTSLIGSFLSSALWLKALGDGIKAKQGQS